MSVSPVTNGSGYVDQASGGSLTLSRPSGIADGDLMVAIVERDDGAVNVILSPPSGWTVADTFDSGNGTVGSNLVYKIASSEPTSWTFSVNNGSIYGVALMSYRNVASSQPDVTLQRGSGTANTEEAPATASTPSSGCYEVVLYTDWSSNPSFTTPTGFTQRVLDQGNAALGIYDNGPLTPTGALAAVDMFENNAANWVAYHFIVSPSTTGVALSGSVTIQASQTAAPSLGLSITLTGLPVTTAAPSLAIAAAAPAQAVATAALTLKLAGTAAPQPTTAAAPILSLAGVVTAGPVVSGVLPGNGVALTGAAVTSAAASAAPVLGLQVGIRIATSQSATVHLALVASTAPRPVLSVGITLTQPPLVLTAGGSALASPTLRLAPSVTAGARVTGVVSIGTGVFVSLAGSISVGAVVTSYSLPRGIYGTHPPAATYGTHFPAGVYGRTTGGPVIGLAGVTGGAASSTLATVSVVSLGGAVAAGALAAGAPVLGMAGNVGAQALFTGAPRLSLPAAATAQALATGAAAVQAYHLTGSAGGQAAATGLFVGEGPIFVFLTGAAGGTAATNQVAVHLALVVAGGAHANVTSAMAIALVSSTAGSGSAAVIVQPINQLVAQVIAQALVQGAFLINWPSPIVLFLPPPYSGVAAPISRPVPGSATFAGGPPIFPGVAVKS